MTTEAAPKPAPRNLGRWQNALTGALCATVIASAASLIRDHIRQGAMQEASAAQHNREFDNAVARIAALEARNCNP